MFYLKILLLLCRNKFLKLRKKKIYDILEVVRQEDNGLITTLTIRIMEDEKIQFDMWCKEHDITMSKAIRDCIRKLINEE